jgi:hypothetical protein
MTVLVERFCKLFPGAQQLYPVRSDTDGAIVYTPDKCRYLQLQPPEAWLVLCPCGNIVDFCGTDVEQAVLVYLADTLIEEHSGLYRVDEQVNAARATHWYKQFQSGILTVLEALCDD